MPELDGEVVEDAVGGRPEDVGVELVLASACLVAKDANGRC